MLTIVSLQKHRIMHAALTVLVRTVKGPCRLAKPAWSHIYVACWLYEQVLQELAGDKGLERFRIEYEKLYRALKKSHGKFESACNLQRATAASSAIYTTVSYD